MPTGSSTPGAMARAIDRRHARRPRGAGDVPRPGTGEPPRRDVRAGHRADPDPGRLQRRGLPRQGPRAERVPALAARLRPRLRPRRDHPGGAGPPGLPRRRPSRACCCSRPRRRCRTAAAGGSSRRRRPIETLLRWIAAGTPRTPADAPALVADRRRAGRADPGRRRRAAAAWSRPTTPTARPRTSPTWPPSSRARAPSSPSTPTAGSRPGRSPARPRSSARFRGHVRHLRRHDPAAGRGPGRALRRACRGPTSSTATSGTSSSGSGSPPRTRPATPPSSAGPSST